MWSNGASFGNSALGDSKNYGTNSLGIGPCDVLPSVLMRLLSVGGDISEGRRLP